ncbi:cytochrome c oxidase accessory protein CcoG [Novosphingobium sp. G106]|uniref:cytochrome c oxidase accessory protein CcoG n=1 Tax=Novosphingobium sp. G106 TaxID=2849500 RepID=UPI001C2D201A|nr:cytochrome c oxidase accessory protein CcoG [Novosphingobium sp. G106]MBV1691947.1 cytochrome c oxidase accessory protein CcoG [Novosphingobium sp. G106]
MPGLEAPPVAPFYEKRKSVFPKAIDGKFRRIKWLWMGVTLAIYYVTPWLRWNRGPYAPSQAVLVDLAHRRFYMFGIEIWPQEFYFVAGLLIMAGIGLFLVTSAVGRAWCGYSCPQTVWTDLFQHVDRIVDGDRNAQIRLQSGPWNAQKIGKRAVKWSIYLFISFWTGGAWILYFADAPTLVRDFWAGEAAPVAYATVAALTATTFVLGGFLREQVCIYMCPWPRIQSAMLDENSLIVTYKDWRGEPRGSVKQASGAAPPLGDCVDCNQCVAVCPTGIDIRDGPQIGCITCALCIDACDAVMAQVGRSRRLIDYVTLEGAEAEKAGAAPQNVLETILRPRTLVYFGIWCAIGLALLFALGVRRHIDLSVAKDRNPPFMVLSDGSLRNAFTVKLLNMESRPRPMEIGLSGLPGAVMWRDDMPRSAASRVLRQKVEADQVSVLRVYVAAPPGSLPQDFSFMLRALDKEGEGDAHTTRFDAPGESE